MRDRPSLLLVARVNQIPLDFCSSISLIVMSILDDGSTNHKEFLAFHLRKVH